MAILFGVVDSERADSISQNLLKNWCPIGAVAPELPENISPFISSFEIQSHFTVRKPDRALDLIRRSWGWYMNNPNGTESTVIEGYLQNGTFGYRWADGYYNDFSYVSHSHGWSSGPTSALTNYIIGLSVTSPGGKTWNLAPQFGDLEFAEAGFVTELGKYQASWTKKPNKYTLQFSVPEMTSGTLVLPFVKEGRRSEITVDGRRVTKGVAYTQDTATIGLDGGSHKVVVQ